MTVLQQEIQRRRTFAIISHPDAGKTTLTEKLLLYGGAIRLAGSVKARKAERHATSDWMDIEKQRGISVTSSVMAFDYGETRINILDTPGHQDFSEDTYRTLIAADSAVMLLDAAKGVEQQTVKLFKVCAARGIPIFTFINKLDRAGRHPYELMEQLENVLGIRSCPVNWPIGTDGDFQGIYNREKQTVELFTGGNHGATRALVQSAPLRAPETAQLLGDYYYSRLREEIELLDAAGDTFSRARIDAGELTPLYFGSAMNNFGVESFLQSFLSLTRPPVGRVADTGLVPADSEQFSGFVFKIQANMNPAHRDRVAFMRVCSGKFEKGMTVRIAASGKEVRLSQPQQFMAEAREGVEEAYPGDIVGLFDPGIFALGDTLHTGAPMQYEGIPLFAPEYFARVSAADTMKRKAFSKGIGQLAMEGAVQLFTEPNAATEEYIVGAVGMLQLEVLEYRLQNEYGVTVRQTPLPYRFVRWVHGAGAAELKLASSARRAQDAKARPVVLFENEWSMRWAAENNKGLELSDTAPR